MKSVGVIGSALAVAMLLQGCAQTPMGPTVQVLPAPGKPFEVFVSEDQYCQGYARQTVGTNAQDAANNAAVGSAVAGTVQITEILGRLSWRQINNYWDLKAAQ